LSADKKSPRRPSWKEPGRVLADFTFLNDDEILVADDLNHLIQQFDVQTGLWKERDRRGRVSVWTINEAFTVVTEYYNNNNFI